MMIFVAVMLFGFGLKAQLVVTNNSGFPVSFCVGWAGDGGVFYTSGWYSIDPHETKKIKTRNSAYYIWGKQYQGGKKIYAGTVNLHVDESGDAFEIKNAQMDYVRNGHPSYVVKKFIDLDKIKSHGVYTFE